MIARTSSWKDFGNIHIPKWVFKDQKKLQSVAYQNDHDKFRLIFECATRNATLGQGAPLAAAVFTNTGTLVSVGVDAQGMGGHEMSNALLVASNVLGSNVLRKDRKWEFFSLAPPCLVCLGHIYSERPRRFACSVTHNDLLSALSLPNIPMPSASWTKKLSLRGIQVDKSIFRQTGMQVLKGRWILGQMA